MCSIVELIAPVLGAPSIQLVVRVDPECAVLGSVLPSCPGHVPPVSVRRIARAFRCRLHHRPLPVCSVPNCLVDASPSCVVGTCPAHCTHPQCRPARDVPRGSHQRPQMSHVDSRVGVSQPMFHVVLTSAQRLLCVGSLLVQNELIQNAALHVALFESTLLIPCVPKWGGGGNPMSIGPATPNNALSLATLNVRRLWLQDESVHDGFHMFCAF